MKYTLRLDKLSILLFAVFFLSLTACAQSTITIKDEAPWYFPSVLEVEPGTTVTWENMGLVVHPVNTLLGPEQFSSGHFTTTYEHTFTEPGIYHYYCPVHPYMQGLIGVGQKVPDEMVPYWEKQWPPETASQPIPGPVPQEAGVGELWLDAQFQLVPGKEKPGTIIIVDAQTWQIKKVIDDNKLNNPHNLWLSEDGNHIFQTNWFDKYLSVIDRYSGFIIKHVYVGESPAHVIAKNGKVYVTLQGADGIAVLDGTTYTVEQTLRTVEEGTTLGKGPHGHWFSADGQLMSVANTEGGSMTVWNTESNEKIFEAEIGPLPLMAGISADGINTWATSLITGEFKVYNVETQELINAFTVGKAPIQAIPSPDGAYVLVALTGDAAVAVVDTQNWELVKTIPSGAGAHGVYYGSKQNGGWYAYISNKFVPWVTVVDMESLSVAGYIPLPKEALGGQGILTVY